MYRSIFRGFRLGAICLVPLAALIGIVRLLAHHFPTQVDAVYGAALGTTLMFCLLMLALIPSAMSGNLGHRNMVLSGWTALNLILEVLVVMFGGLNLIGGVIYMALSLAVIPLVIWVLNELSLREAKEADRYI